MEDNAMQGNRDNDRDKDGPFIFGNEREEGAQQQEVSAEVDLGNDFEQEELEELKDSPEREVDDDRMEYSRRSSPQTRGAPQASNMPRQNIARRSTSSTLNFETALKIVELKFRFWQHFAAYVLASGILLVINQIIRVRSGYAESWWFQWPVLVYGVLLIIPFCRAYLFRGQDIRSMVERRLKRMAEREMARSEIYDE